MTAIRWFNFILLSSFCAIFSTHLQADVQKTPQVVIETSMGDITVELLQQQAPISVKNFLAYVSRNFYDGTTFHRVIPGFMIQGGGFDINMKQKPTQAPIKNEAKNGLTNLRGTLAMARTPAVDSATSQFFINLVDNNFLNHGEGDYGYAVFGHVIKGMDVVDRIAQTPTMQKGHYGNVPVTPVVIKKVYPLQSASVPK